MGVFIVYIFKEETCVCVCVDLPPQEVSTYLASSFFCSSSASSCIFLCWLSFSLLILFSSSTALFWAMFSSGFPSS